MSPPQVIVGKVIAPDVRTGFNEVDTTCDIGFNGTYLTCVKSGIVVNNSAVIITDSAGRRWIFHKENNFI